MEIDHILDTLFTSIDTTEVIFNGYNKLWIENCGQLKEIESQFSSLFQYNKFIDDLCELVDSPLTLEKPFVESRYRNYRVSVVSNSLTQSEHGLSLRKINPNSWSLDEMVDKNWCTYQQLNYIKKLLLSRENFLVIGATGSGKTTFMSSLIKAIPSDQRVISIEDTSELSLEAASGLKLLTRSNQNSILNEINQSDLLKRALRLRPDRIVVGEVRGAEAKDLLLALSTGHAGSFSSLHANDPHQALIRLEMLVQMGAPQWNLTTVRRLIQLSLKYILLVERTPTGIRRLKSISKISSLEDHGFCLEDLEI